MMHMMFVSTLLIAAQMLPTGFQRLDKDANGEVSLAEWQADRAATFQRTDKDRSGGLDRAETTARVGARYPDLAQDAPAFVTRVDRMMSADQNNDSIVDAQESAAASEKEYRTLDRDRSGELTTKDRLPD